MNLDGGAVREVPVTADRATYLHNTNVPSIFQQENPDLVPAVKVPPLKPLQAPLDSGQPGDSAGQGDTSRGCLHL